MENLRLDLGKNIKTDVKEIGQEGWIGLFWLTRGKCGCLRVSLNAGHFFNS
jgi:hypothetical protein